MSHDTDKLIRQLSLVAFLMAELRPLTARDVKSNVEGYSEMSDEAFARRFYSDRAELVALGVPAARCTDPRIVSEHPQMQARGFYETVVHPELGAYPSGGLPYRFASVDVWQHRATPTLGQHNSEVLTRICGVTADQLAALEASGIIGTRPRGS